MKISAISSYSRTSFKRAPKPEEEKDFHNDIEEGKKYLGIKDLALIMHGSSFPVSNMDLFIGSPMNKKAKEINNLLKLHGFDSIQLGPPGLIQRDDFSPYISSIHSRNYLFADMEKLTTSEYGKILKLGDIEEYTDSEYINKSKETIFNAAFDAYDHLFELAYDNMMSQAKSGNDDSVNLLIDFAKFKKEENSWLETDALFDVLTEVNGSDHFDEWNDIDDNLITYIKDENSPLHKQALQRKAELKDKYQKDIDLYKFKQFIVKKQEKEFAKSPEKLKYKSDAIIGFSARDIWANKEAFLHDYRIGCPYGGQGEAIHYSSWGNNQLWDIAFVAPDKLFNPDGTIGIGGKLIQDKFRALLENHQSIRIDHVLGLVDPWVYNKNRVEIIKDGDRIVHTIAHGANVSMFGKPNAYKIEDFWGWDQKEMQRKINADIENMPNIDPDGNYKRLIHEILLPVIKEKGLKPTDLAWENLGAPTNVFNEVCYGNNNTRPDGDTREIIPGMSSLKSYKGQDEAKSVPDNTFLIQSHDDEHTGKLLTNNFFQEKKNSVMDPLYLIGTLYPDLPENSDEVKGIKWEDSRDFLINKMAHNTDLRTIVKWQELFRFGKNIQVTFMDFFGLPDRYNYSGTNDPRNWKLRLPLNYKAEYYKTLQRAKHDDKKDPMWWQHLAMNIPELLERAVISKAMNEGKSKESVKNLTDRLHHWAEVLYAPDDADI